MALRDQPFLPLYIQDFLTDEKLIECSASATGVYIRIMCLMHKEEQYGKILLKQKYKQSAQQISNFALQLSGKVPYPLPIIEAGLNELLTEEVLRIKGDVLYQKRMVEDNELSLKRSKSGKLGVEAKGSKNKKVAGSFAIANPSANGSANTENEYESENVNENVLYLDRGLEKDLPIVPQMLTIFQRHFPHYPAVMKTDYPALLQIAQKLAKIRGLPDHAIQNGSMQLILQDWTDLVKFAVTDKWYKTRSISDLNNEFQRLIQAKNGQTERTGSNGRAYKGGPTNGLDPNAVVLTGAGDDL